MPGYLIKTANFVAEILSDEELTHLAEVGTIQKDTQICVQPGKTWVEAKKLPILRKIWGLEAGPSVPPPIKMVGVASSSPIKTKLPPSLKTEIAANPLFDVMSAMADVTEPESEAVSAELIGAIIVSGEESGVEDGVPESSDCQRVDSEVLLPIDDEEDELMDLCAVSRASESSLSFEFNKIQELSNVSHTWELSDGTSTKDMPSMSIARGAHEASMQDLDVLSGIELEAVGEQTEAIVRPQIRQEMDESSSVDSAVEAEAGGDDVQPEESAKIDSKPLEESKPSLSENEYVEAMPDEVTYVIDTRDSETGTRWESNEPVRPGRNNGDGSECPSIEIRTPEGAYGKGDCSESELAGAVAYTEDETEKLSVESELDEVYRSPLLADVRKMENDIPDMVPLRHEVTSMMSGDFSHQDENVVDAEESGADVTDSIEELEDKTSLYGSDFAISAPVPLNTIRGISSIRQESGQVSIPAFGKIEKREEGGASIRPYMPGMYQPTPDRIEHECVPESAAVSEKPVIKLEEKLQVLVNLEERLPKIESFYDVSGAFNLAACKIPLEESNSVLPASETRLPEGVVEARNVMPVPEEMLETLDNRRSPAFEHAADAGLSPVSGNASSVGKGATSERLGSFSEAPSGDDIESLFSGMEPEQSGVRVPVLHSETTTEPFIKIADGDNDLESAGQSYDDSMQIRTRIRSKRISHRSHGSRSMVTNVRELFREKQLSEQKALIQPGSEVPSGGRSSSYGEQDTECHDEFAAARAAVEAAIKAASQNGGVNERVLRKAVSFVDALNDAAHGMESSSEEHHWTDDIDDENPSDIFRIRSRQDLELGLRADMAYRTTETSPTFRRRPDFDACQADCLSYVEEDSSSDRFKIRGCGELRRMLSTEKKASDMDSIASLPVSTEDYCKNEGGELRKLFEKQDELHLFLGKGVREQESVIEQQMPKDEDLEDVYSNVTQDSVTAGMPKRNSGIVVRPVEREAPEPTKITSAYVEPGEGENKALAVAHEFIKKNLYPGESQLADFDSLHLTNMRVFSIDVKHDSVINYEAFDIESIQSFGLHEHLNLHLIVIDAICILLSSIFMLRFRNWICLAILIFFCVMIPVLYVISLCKSVQFNCSSGRFIRSRHGVTKENHKEAMEFLSRVDVARQERRRYLTGGR